jgi:hypothetical protein
MRKGARFVFVSDGLPQAAWRGEEEQRLIRYAWRVVAANNHSLGRSGSSFESHAAALADATIVRAGIAGQTFNAVVEGTLGHWMWRVGDRHQAVAVGTREYSRRSECLRSADQFLTVVRAADPTVAVLMPLGPQALQVYSAEVADSPTTAVLHLMTR